MWISAFCGRASLKKGIRMLRQCPQLRQNERLEAKSRVSVRKLQQNGSLSAEALVIIRRGGEASRIRIGCSCPPGNKTGQNSDT